MKKVFLECRGEKESLIYPLSVQPKIQNIHQTHTSFLEVHRTDCFPCRNRVCVCGSPMALAHTILVGDGSLFFGIWITLNSESFWLVPLYIFSYTFAKRKRV
jgi:hypothetical protein